jgi:hypothetical protein
MFIDESLELADNAAVADASSDTLIGSAKQIRAVTGDNATVDLSAGEPLYLVIEVTTALSAVTNYQFKVWTDSDSGVIAGGTQLWASGVNAIAYYPAGKRFIINLPEGDYKEYIGVSGAASGADSSGAAGNINAFITKDVSNWTGTATRVPATDPAN